MIDPVTLALVVSSLIIVIGFLGRYLFERTGVPDMLFLIALGIIFGPILRIFDPTALAGLAPYIATLALIFILFDGGLRMGIYQILIETPRAELLAIISFVLSFTVIALFMHYLIGIPLLYGVLFGSICGGSSSIAVVSFTKRVKMSEKFVNTMIVESAITDILSIVASLAVIGILLAGHADYLIVSKEIASQFSTGAVVGVLFGVLWLSILKRLARERYAYMLTLATLLVAYTVSEYLGGSGALSSLLFGVILGNEKEIFKILKRERTRNTLIDEGMKRFESEIAFLIGSFFFVYLGLISSVADINLLILGLILSFLLLCARSAAVTLATARSPLWDKREIMSTMLTRGLAAAVLSTLPLQYGLPYADIYINLELIIIIATAAVSTVGGLALSHKKAEKQ